tara:strand:- start:1675 stop:1938 length:264 start_codon:yes stop_codon:yes gene_type:complete
MPATKKRVVRAQPEPRKEVYGEDCIRLYFGLLCIISLLAAVTVANDAAIHLIFGPPPAPPPPPPPPVKQGFAALVEGLVQWGKYSQA